MEKKERKKERTERRNGKERKKERKKERTERRNGKERTLENNRSRYTLLMRSNKIETAVQCFRMSHASVRWIFWSW